MSYTASDLTSEINAKINEFLASGQGQISAKAITLEIMASHATIEGPDSDFHICCAQITVRDFVRRSVRKYTPSETEPYLEQLVLDGFERLQVAYSITRGDDAVLVRLDNMSEAEVVAKIKELEGLRAGLDIHIRELKRHLIAKFGPPDHLQVV